MAHCGGIRGLKGFLGAREKCGGFCGDGSRLGTWAWF